MQRTAVDIIMFFPVERFSRPTTASHRASGVGLADLLSTITEIPHEMRHPPMVFQTATAETLGRMPSPRDDLGLDNQNPPTGDDGQTQAAQG